MADFHFTTQRRKARIGRKIITYDVITAWDIAALDFPDDEAADAWESDFAHFENEISRYSDLEIINVAGRRMYACQYTFELADWIFQSALDLGAMVGSREPSADDTSPYSMEEPAPMESEQSLQQPATDMQDKVETAREKENRESEKQIQQSKENTNTFIQKVKNT